MFLEPRLITLLLHIKLLEYAKSFSRFLKENR